MDKNIVFVIGAGASNEVNLPTGDALKNEISNLLNINSLISQKTGDHIICEALVNLIRSKGNNKDDYSAYLSACKKITSAIPQAESIDNFIHNHRDNEKIALCGKLAIVRSILHAEKNSHLYFRHYELAKLPSIFINIEKTWYKPFFNLVTNGCDKNSLSKRFEKITIISFNYDRCIEHFIYFALQNYYDISPADAASLVKIIKIFHPYGCVGSLPWQNQIASIAFGSEPGPSQLLTLSEQIKTFTEETDQNSKEVNNIKASIADTDILVFLGFAFHKLNLRILNPIKKHNKSHKIIQCYATSYRISDSDKNIIESDISSLLGNSGNIKMINEKCNVLFNEFGRSLTFY